jgi:anti-sigma B factor antagonist
MSTTEFGARVRHEDGSAVVELTGEITSAAEGGLNNAYAEVAGEPKVVLDFSGVDYINSTGIAVIVAILAQARKNGQELQAGGLAEHYREIFRITRLSDFMTILDDGEGGR